MNSPIVKTECIFRKPIRYEEEMTYWELKPVLIDTKPVPEPTQGFGIETDIDGKLLQSFYVGNSVTSVNTRGRLDQFMSQSTAIMKLASFDLRGRKYNGDNSSETQTAVLEELEKSSIKKDAVNTILITLTNRNLTERPWAKIKKSLGRRLRNENLRAAIHRKGGEPPGTRNIVAYSWARRLAFDHRAN
ncbi:hypothetical protein M0802_008613 [Mischocyttarus mexicanus]|nr:hypothetical protein M0802_008613 [Mischocyttarus mexicanus]